MARSNRRARGSLGALLAGLAGAFLLASPAGAQTTNQTSGGALAFNDSVASGTCVATNDSTCSGSGRATGDSTSSGSAVAVDGSVSSGCATAINDSTASGAPCPPATTATTRPATSTGGGATAARPAAATAAAGRSLALTGSSNGELAGAGALAVLAGALLVRAARKDGTARTA
ncbi:MAG TPA: hypothetical protein VFK43_01105 [Acidimicrobiales bacterium]|nr:hypothetical protein [Acidimicrobiales bacterium]